MPEDRIDKLIKRWRRLEGDKGPYLSHCEDLARVMLSGRIGFTTTTVSGERRTDDIFDGTPMQAARGLANAIGGMLRPEGLPQIEIKAEDEGLNNLGEAKDWMAFAEERLKNSFNNPHARFRQASGEIDQDLVVLGTGVMYVGESQRRNRLLFQSLHLKDATPFFSEEGVPEGIFLRRNLPARQLEARFGRNKLSEKTRQILEKTPDEKVEVLHVILPREEARANALFARNLPFADLWIEVDAKHELSVGGFHEFPFIIPRWDTTSGEDSGRSPGMIALPDSDTLQAMGETILIAGQRAADPPLMAPNDGSFDSLNTFPGGISYYDVETAVAMRGNPFFSLESGTNLPITRDMQQDTRQQVLNAFFKNILNLPVDGPDMTATEIIARKEEFMREVGPVFGRLETDYTAPMVERAFMIMLRAGAFLPIPEALSEQNIRFEYDSPVKRIRQQIEATAASRWAQEMIVLGEVKPGAIDLINEDELGRFSAEALGIPGKIVNSVDVVAEIRAARQEAMEEQKQADALLQGMEVAKMGSEVVDKLSGKPAKQSKAA
jgi:hypothetical protein